MLMNKKGSYLDGFLWIIFSFIIIIISALFIYMGATVQTKLHETMDTMDIGGTVNVTQQIDSSIGAVNTAYASLYWISIFLIVGMAMAIFIGSYLVTTKPIFFIPYIIVTIITVIVSVGISNGYEMIIADPTLASTFNGFLGANYIMSYLPMWTAIIGITGGIIMFARMGREQEVGYVG